MRHLLVTNDFPPKVGGIQNYLWDLWSRLPPESYVVLTASSDEGAAAFDDAQAERGVHIERVPASTLFFPTPAAHARGRAMRPRDRGRLRAARSGASPRAPRTTVESALRRRRPRSRSRRARALAGRALRAGAGAARLAPRRLGGLLSGGRGEAGRARPVGTCRRDPAGRRHRVASCRSPRPSAAPRVLGSGCPRRVPLWSASAGWSLVREWTS